MIVRRVRPRFRILQPQPPDAVIARIVEHLKRPDCPCKTMVSNPHGLVDLRVRESERHMWSPALAVTVSKDKSGEGSVLDGMVGPNPDVWTFFAMLYTGLWTFIMFALIFGVVQWSLGHSPWGFWLTAGLTVLMLFAYASSQVGQRLAAPQTAMLRHLLEEALDLPDAERAVTDYDPYHGRRRRRKA